MTNVHRRAIEAHMQARDGGDPRQNIYHRPMDEAPTEALEPVEEESPTWPYIPWDLIIISLLCLGFLVGWICGRTHERYSDEHRQEIGGWPK